MSTPVLTNTTVEFMKVFHNYTGQFQIWGSWLFFTLLTINLIWFFLWQGFEKNDLTQAMPDFLKRFTVITIFYTFMSHPEWLHSIPETATAMGFTLTGVPIDPTSLISAGIGVANKIIFPVAKSSLLTAVTTVFVIMLAYLCILFCFISIALDLALTLVMSSVLTCVATFFLGFGAMGATSPVARQTLDVILANSVKLLGLYLVVGAGATAITAISNLIPMSVMSLDGYIWIVCAVVFFWLLAKKIPPQLASIVSGGLQASQGTGIAALAMTASQQGRLAMTAATQAMKMAMGVAKIAGSTVNNGAARFSGSMDKTGSVGLSTLSAAAGAAGTLAKSTGGNVADHFKNVAAKIAGGPGQRVAGVSERLYKDAQTHKAKVTPPKSPSPS